MHDQRTQALNENSRSETREGRTPSSPSRGIRNVLRSIFVAFVFSRMYSVMVAGTRLLLTERAARPHTACAVRRSFRADWNIGLARPSQHAQKLSAVYRTTDTGCARRAKCRRRSKQISISPAAFSAPSCHPILSASLSTHHRSPILSLSITKRPHQRHRRAHFAVGRL
jgi:hypothetical protein